MLWTALSMLLLASIISADVAGSDSVEVRWPSSAINLVLREQGETNAERLRRGLQPLPPKRLYNPRREVGKRLDGAPGTATPSNGAYQYYFNYCSYYVDQVPSSYTITGTNLQTVANQCASYAGGPPFALGPGSQTNEYICAVNPGTAYRDYSGCPNSDYAYYTR